MKYLLQVTERSSARPKKTRNPKAREARSVLVVESGDQAQPTGYEHCRAPVVKESTYPGGALLALLRLPSCWKRRFDTRRPAAIEPAAGFTPSQMKGNTRTRRCDNMRVTPKSITYSHGRQRGTEIEQAHRQRVVRHNEIRKVKRHVHRTSPSPHPPSSLQHTKAPLVIALVKPYGRAIRCSYM